jgi:microcystin degradation protein MlrC
MRIAILGMFHETNTFALEQNDILDVPHTLGEALIERAHPRSYVGGFVEAARRPEVELIPIGLVDFLAGFRGGIITARVFCHFRDLLLQRLKEVLPVDGIYFALHGAMAVEAPYEDAEASLIRAVKELVGPTVPCTGTYDFHSNYTEWECSALLPFPLNTNPHIDAYERGIEAAEALIRMLRGELQPTTRYIRIPIIGPNIGQSTWNHDPEAEARLPLYQLNQMRADLEQTPGVVNLTIQGGYGYSDLPYAGMSVIATTHNDPDLAGRLANQLALAVWDKREEIRTVRPILPIDEGVQRAIRNRDGLTCLVDLGDDPGSYCPADSPAVLESLLRLGGQDAALTIRDPEVVQAGMAAGVGAELTIAVGAKIDQRFYQPLMVSGRVKSIDDGHYKIVGPTHGGWGREVVKESFRDAYVGPRVVLRIGNKIDVIFSHSRTGKDRDFFKSAGIVFEEKQIVVVKSNQAHRASFDPIVNATIELDTPGVSTPTYTRLPFRNIQRPIYPIDMDIEWQPKRPATKER